MKTTAIDLTQGSITGTMLRFAVPMIAGNLLQQVYNLADTLIVGHFLGVYGMGGKFDLQANRTFCYQGEFFSAGLTYGYSMPIAKRVNLEFSISAGYARIPYRHYNPTDDWELLIRDRNKSGVWHYFGPTKIEVALSVPLLVKTKVKGGNR